MSDKPINLNRVRKARSRDEARRQANENAVKFGLPKAERERQANSQSNSKRKLDAHKRDTTE